MYHGEYCAKVAIYGLIIYMAPDIMLLMRGNPIGGQVGGGWALEIENFLGPVSAILAQK